MAAVDAQRSTADQGGPSPGALDADFAGLDALELVTAPERGAAARVWSAAWPKLGAAALAVFLWQCVVWSGWKPEYILPGPARTLSVLREGLADGTIGDSVVNTMRRAVTGFALAVVIGGTIGAVLTRVALVRVAFGSLITGLQTMPSVAWFPLAIVLFQLSERAILFVVVLGAAPAIANGLIQGADTIPPILLRAGRVLGARGLTMVRHVVLPAALPSFLGGLKQGWAFAWRSLMAGELLVIIGNKPSLGSQLEINRQLAAYDGLVAFMVVILVIGIIVDSLVFGFAERAVRRRYGLLVE